MPFASINAISPIKCVQVVSRDDEGYRMEKSKNREADDYDSFFRVFLYCCYYIGIAPFRLDKDTEGIYRIHKNYLQLVYCGCIHFFILARQLMSLRGFSLLAEDFKKQPVMYFKITSDVALLAFMITFCKTLWMNAQGLRLVLQEVSAFSQRFPSPVNSRVKTQSVAIAICTLYIVHPFIKLAAGPSPARDWNFENTFKFNLNYARSSLFYLGESNLTNKGFTDLSIQDHFMAWVSIFLYIYTTFVDNFACVATLFACLSIWYPARALARTTETRNSLSLAHQGRRTSLDMYESIKIISDMMNNTFGSMVLYCLAYEISYYSLNLDNAMKIEAGWFTLLRVMEIGIHFSIDGFASNICSKVNSVKVWISDSSNHLSLSQNELILLLDELNCCYVGIKGNGLFSINYGFMGSCFILAVTLFTVMIQFSKIKN